MNSIHHIVIIGAGNVATHLADAFQQSGKKIDQIYSRSAVSAKNLATKLDCSYTTNINELNVNSELYLVAVKDEVLPEILKKIKLKKKLIVHTSGLHPMHLLKKCSENYGIFYPLQTLTIKRKINTNAIPICIEANSKTNQELLSDLAHLFTENVRIVDSEKRKILHLAAVFACNYTNHLYSIAEDILKNAEIPFNLLHPLIKETAEKAIETGPFEAQTGPARRNDLKVIQSHKKLLTNKEQKNIYSLLSKSIIKKYFQKDNENEKL